MLGRHLLLVSQQTRWLLEDGLSARLSHRLGLNVADEAASRAVIGTADAAKLPLGGHGYPTTREGTVRLRPAYV